MAEDVVQWRNRIVGYGEIDPRELVANPKNWRLHAAVQQAAIDGVLADVGWVDALMVNKTTNFLVDGHMRAARAIVKQQTKVPVLWVELTEAEEDLVLLTFDPIAAMAGQVESQRASLASTVRSDNEAVRKLIASAARDAEEARKLNEDGDESEPSGPSPAEMASQEWGTATGDVWEVPSAALPGRVHRLIVGDARDAAVWRAVGDGLMCLWTDPPYGVDYAAKNAMLNKTDRGNRVQAAIENDALSDDGLLELLLAAWKGCDGALAEGSGVYVAHPGGPLSVVFGRSVLEAGWVYHEQLIWVKTPHVLGMSDYHYKHEPVIYGWKPGKAHRWYGARDKVTVLEVPKPQSSSLHPTMKPLELIMPMLENSTLRGDTVLDPFLGSGSTMVASEQIGRLCTGVELDAGYAGIVLGRMAALGCVGTKVGQV